MTTYAVYGLRLQSEWPLPGYLPVEGPAELRLRAANPERFAALRRELPAAGPDEAWPYHAPLDDGSVYLRWGEQFEFRISPGGDEIEGIAHPGASLEGFHTYLLGQVLSFVLIQRGLEPLHATVVATPCGAVGFLADSGVGKSTLASAFLAEGDALVTDDLMITRREGGAHLVLPGPPRIKLFPEVAAARAAAGGEARMNPLTAKLVIPLAGADRVDAPVPLRRLYLLAPGRPTGTRVALRRLAGPLAFRALMQSTYNNYVDAAERLRAQFRVLTALAAEVPVARLSYPRRLDALGSVRRRVLADACRG